MCGLWCLREGMWLPGIGGHGLGPDLGIERERFHGSVAWGVGPMLTVRKPVPSRGGHEQDLPSVLSPARSDGVPS